MDYSVVFFGSPDFAIPSLIAVNNNYKITGVVTQPDRPAGRGKVVTPPPVKVLAKELGIPLIQPDRLKDPGVIEQLRKWNADVYVVAAFGQIFRKNILDIPPYGFVNVHASLLPRWRGAAPIQAAILAGDEYTGITIMKVDQGIDTGDIISQKQIKIMEQETAGELSERLAIAGAELLIETLPAYLSGIIESQQQNEAESTYAGMIRKEDAILGAGESAQMMERKIRAYHPWPVARLGLENSQVLIHKVRVEMGINLSADVKYIYKGFPAISTVNGLLVLEVIQLPGKKPIDGKAFINSNRNWGEQIL
jgi:methionyl-tRNA formyltransferase